MLLSSMLYVLMLLPVHTWAPASALAISSLSSSGRRLAAADPRPGPPALGSPRLARALVPVAVRMLGAAAAAAAAAVAPVPVPVPQLLARVFEELKEDPKPEPGGGRELEACGRGGSGPGGENPYPPTPPEVLVVVLLPLLTTSPASASISSAIRSASARHCIRPTSTVPTGTRPGVKRSASE
jgi:hypothetical protein